LRFDCGISIALTQGGHETQNAFGLSRPLFSPSFIEPKHNRQKSHVLATSLLLVKSTIQGDSTDPKAAYAELRA
jgi:hypothetical protein